MSRWPTIWLSLRKATAGSLGPLLTADLDQGLVAALGINIVPFR
jgi:hypothetical protein